ncbi:L-rhamnose operon regulatory protein rhaS [Chromobacterium violaceum]|uniref:L-rhamnose operon regulatory protein rhaS n=1 Tax=Chromobacterium violaceum TaxID=536 RepID=A0A447TEL8_CHRVL|nr:L-rhamnose operon regulatory protein rhaS [Chromobacterium violaceum]
MSFPMPRPRVELLHYGSDSVRHAHACHHQWVFGLSGSLELEMEGRPYLNGAGWAVCIPAGVSHCYAGSAGNRQLVLNVPVLSDGRDDAARQLILPPAARELAEWAARHPQPQARQSALAGMLMDLLLADAPSAFRLSSRLDRFLDGRLARPLAVADMAEACHLSSSQFHARLKAETGLTPMAYLCRMRMERARALLRDSRASVLDVALQVGYQSASAFGAAYRQRFGASPSEGRGRVRRA